MLRDFFFVCYTYIITSKSAPMFSNYSMTGTGMVTLLLSWILSAVGVEAGEESIAGFVQAVLTAVGFVWMVWGQLRRSDLELGLFRK